MPRCTAFSALKSRDKEVWPVVGFDPFQQYIEDLKVSQLPLMRHSVPLSFHGSIIAQVARIPGFVSVVAEMFA